MGVQLYYICLLEHCSSCFCEEGLVILNSKTDQYLYVPPDEAKYIIDGNMHGISATNERHAQSLCDVSIQELFDIDVLCIRGRPSPIYKVNRQIVNQHREVVGTGNLFPPKIHMKDIIFFLHAVFRGVLLRKFFSVRLIYRRQEILNNNMGKYQNNKLRKLDDLLDIYSYLSCLTFTRKGRCFFNSLVLSRFLASYGYKTYWIFGVALDPFRAHCWVAVDDAVVDEYLSNIAIYDIIMVI